MDDNQFMKLFKGIEDVKSRLDSIEESMATKDEPYSRLDDIAAQIDSSDTEQYFVQMLQYTVV